MEAIPSLEFSSIDLRRKLNPKGMKSWIIEHWLLEI